jgi:hypothetical protein
MKNLGIKGHHDCSASSASLLRVQIGTWPAPPGARITSRFHPPSGRP